MAFGTDAHQATSALFLEHVAQMRTAKAWVVFMRFFAVRSAIRSVGAAFCLVADYEHSPLPSLARMAAAIRRAASILSSVRLIVASSISAGSFPYIITIAV